MALTPMIDYSHVLSELSVNRQDPCELLRELISNSYDAHAKDIWFFPLEQYEGIIFIDNGQGLNTIPEAGKSISNYEAFFSIGKTTKTKGENIGYKCQGSKLCFASSEVTVISKFEGKENWIYKRIDNPRTNLSVTTDITPAEDNDVYHILNGLFSEPDLRTKNILNNIKDVIKPDVLKSSTIIVIKNISVEEYARYYTVRNGDKELLEESYVYNYIRFYTKHGDVRIVNSKHGFKEVEKQQLDEISKKNKGVNLHVWDGEELHFIEPGYPYIEVDTDIEPPLLASKLSRLRAARFYDRKAKVIRYKGQKYSFILALDGNRRALEKYSNLDRQGASKSGLKLTDQRGTYISSQGIKTCIYSQLWQEALLNEYSCLADNDIQSHYLFLIDGPFDLVTNRNSISNDALKILKEIDFINLVKDFIDECSRDNVYFKDFIEVIKKKKDAENVSEQIKALEETKSSLENRERFIIKNIPQLKNKWFIAPESSDEHWVGTLYTLLSHFVPEDSKYRNLWLRPLTYSGRGIDSVGTFFDESSFELKILKSIEYKNRFNPTEILNHPLNIIDFLVCWSYGEIDFNKSKTIEDDYNMLGTLSENSGFEECSFKINQVESKTGMIFDNEIIVVSLRNLIFKTFDCRVSNSKDI